MKIVFFNINGLCVWLYQLVVLIEWYQFDVIGLQEIKVVDDQFFQVEIEVFGYYVYYYGQKGYYGVVLFFCQVFLELYCGFLSDGEEFQWCFIWGIFSDVQGNLIIVMNGYFL